MFVELSRGGGSETTFRGCCNTSSREFRQLTERSPLYTEGKGQGGGRKADDEASHQQLIVTEYLPWALCYSKHYPILLSSTAVQ